MSRRHISADPTANAAIKRADRAARNSVLGERQRPRPIVKEFAELFDPLTDAQVRRVVFEALALAKGNPWGVTKSHLEQALVTTGIRPRPVA